MMNRRKHKNRRDAMAAEKASHDHTFGPIASLRLSCRVEDSYSELLLLPDGQVLVHNLTPAFADLLKELNPNAEQIAARTRPSTHHALSRGSRAKAETRLTSHELPD